MGAKDTDDTDAPSLAVVFLPAPLPVLPPHTLYLPISLSTTSADLDSDPFSRALQAALAQENAEAQWAPVGVSPDQHLLWHVDLDGARVLRATQVSTLDPVDVFLGFEPLLRRRQRMLNVLREQIAAAPSVTM